MYKVEFLGCSLNLDYSETHGHVVKYNSFNTFNI